MVKCLLPKDYVRLRITGEFATEVSDASGTLLLDVQNRKWSAPLLKKLDLDASILPKVFESEEVSGGLSAEAAKLTGLPVGTAVVGGGGDQAASAVGNGIVRKGVLSATMGTAGWCLRTATRSRSIPKDACTPSVMQCVASGM